MYISYLHYKIQIFRIQQIFTKISYIEAYRMENYVWKRNAQAAGANFQLFSKRIRIKPAGHESPAFY